MAFEEYETIQEELEEYEFQNIQPPLSRLQANNHCFNLPARFRAASSGTYAELNQESEEAPDQLQPYAVESEPNDSIAGLLGSSIGDQKSRGSMSTAHQSGERHSSVGARLSQSSAPMFYKQKHHPVTTNLFFELAYKSGKKKGLQRTQYKGKRNKL